MFILYHFISDLNLKVLSRRVTSHYDKFKTLDDRQKFDHISLSYIIYPPQYDYSLCNMINI